MYVGPNFYTCINSIFEGRFYVDWNYKYCAKTRWLACFVPTFQIYQTNYPHYILDGRYILSSMTNTLSLITHHHDLWPCIIKIVIRAIFLHYSAKYVIPNDMTYYEMFTDWWKCYVVCTCFWRGIQLSALVTIIQVTINRFTPKKSIARIIGCCRTVV